MITLTDPTYYYKLIREFDRTQSSPEPMWLGTPYFNGFKEWLKKTHNVNFNGSSNLTFDNQYDYEIFLLKWS